MGGFAFDKDFAVFFVGKYFADVSFDFFYGGLACPPACFFKAGVQDAVEFDGGWVAVLSGCTG